MRRLWILLALLCCASPVWAETFYVAATGGSDSNSCTSSGSRCNTIAGVIAKAAFGPGDTILLGDGTYGPAQSPQIDCATNPSKLNGTASARITLKAENERQAFLKGDGSAYPFYMENCAYWTIEGLRAESGDFSTSPLSSSWAFAVQYGTNVIIRRNLVRFNNRYKNGGIFQVQYCTNCLVEENEIYSYSRHGFTYYNSSNTVLRRNYANSRGHADIPGGFPSAFGTTNGDSGYVAYPASNNLLENNISEGNSHGYALISGSSNTPVENNRHHGNISLNDSTGAFMIGARDTNVYAMNNMFADHAVVGSEVGWMHRSTKANTCTNCSFLGGFGAGFSADKHPSHAAAPPYSVFGTNILITNRTNAAGVYIAPEVGTWNINEVNSYNSNPNYSPASSGNYSNQISTDPQMGTCKVWIPASSPMKGAGVGGADIGANILYRYENGTLTTTPLWEAGSGRFPCGAVIPGVNDVAGQSCQDVHVRLNVNTGGCSFPSGYPTDTTPPGPVPFRIVGVYDFEAGLGTLVPNAVDPTSNGEFTPDGGWAAGAIGASAGSFDGTRYVEIANPSSLRQATTAQTLSAWVKMTSLPTGCDVISNGNSTVLRVHSTGSLEGLYYNGTTWPYFAAGSGLLDNSWHHILWTFNGTTQYSWIDNHQVGSLVSPGSIAYSLGATATIGHHGNGGTTRTCQGLIDKAIIAEGYCSPECVADFYAFGPQTPAEELSAPYVRFMRADGAEGMPLGPLGASIVIDRNGKVRMRWALRNGGL